MNAEASGAVRPVSPTRISTVVYAALTLLAVAAGATAKGYVDSLSQFSFIVLVSAGGLVVAHLWSDVLAHRLSEPASLHKQWLQREAIGSSTMMLPGILMVVVAWIAHLLTGDLEAAVTVSMGTVVIALFAYTWVGTSRGDVAKWSGLSWALGTAGVGALTIVFKVVF